MTGASIRERIRAGLWHLGISVRRARDDGRYTMLGLRRRPIRGIVDVGANEGQFARAMLPVFPNARIICFEPASTPFASLSAWASGTHGRVTCIQCAVGDAQGVLSLRVHNEHSPSSSLLATTPLAERLYPQTRAQSAQQVPVRRLDDALFAAGVELDGEILLKIDVQGFEDRVLRGGVTTLARTTACLLEVNLDRLYEGQAEFAELVSLLNATGLAYAGNLEQVCEPDGHVVYLDALFLRNRW